MNSEGRVTAPEPRAAQEAENDPFAAHRLYWTGRPTKTLSQSTNGSPYDDLATLVEDLDCMLDNKSERRSNSDESTTSKYDFAT